MADQFELTEEVNKIQDDVSNYDIPNEITIVGKSDQELARYLNEIADSIQLSSESMNDPIVFDKIRSFLKYFKHVKPNILSRLLDIILSAFRLEIKSLEEDLNQNEKDTFQYHRTSLELYSFLIHWFLMLAEDNTQAKSNRKSKIINTKPDAFDWNSQKIKAFDLTSWLLGLKLSKIWTLSSERTTFTTLFTKPAYQLLENPVQAKVRPLKDRIFRILGLCIKHYDHLFVAQNTIMQHLQYWEHSAEPMVELLIFMVDKENYTQLADEILREISNVEFKDTTSKEMKDTPNPRTFALFLQKLAESSPKTVLKNLAILINQLDCESYLMRSAIIDILGVMIVELSKTSKDNPNQVIQINDYFDIFEQRMLDTSAYVRQKVLQVYIRLFELKFKFPKRRQTATELAIRHLQDKTNLVRKYAIRLLISLMSTHPYNLYGGELNLQEWTSRLETLKAEMEKVTTEEEMASFNIAHSEQDTDENKENEEPSTPLPKAPTTEKKVVSPEQYQQLQMMLTFHRDAIGFIEHIHIAIPIIIQLLSSKSKAEVLESMDFLVTAYNYKVISASEGVRRMFHLIWTNDTNDEGKGIKMKVLSSYQKLYLEADTRISKSANIARISKDLVESTYDISVADLTSLEEILSTLMTEGKIDNAIVDKLWLIYTFPPGKINKAQRKGAIMILGMLAKTNTRIVSGKVDTMLKFGLGSLGEADLGLAKYTCLALQRLEGTRPKQKKGGVYEGTRYPERHRIFTVLKDAINNTTNNLEWYCLAEQIINTIFLICQKPEFIVEDIIRERAKKLFDLNEPSVEQSDNNAESSTSRESPGEAMDTDYDRSMTQQESPFPQKPLYKSSNELSQLFFIVGHVALKQIVHLEVIESVWKRKKNKKESEQTRPEGEGEGEDELEQVAGNAEDEIGEAISRIREEEILYGSSNLLGLFGPMLVEVCARNKVYTDPTLQVTATLALSKFMCVSSRFCENNLQLFFTILEKSKDPKIRGNLVIALGDLAVSFSTLIDDNITFLYNRLGDTDATVRKNTVMVLTHLILNGMVKVKGQISEMAKCLEDADQRISELAKLFFTELASKDNAIYNNLPDIISNLTSSQPKRLEEEAFKRIMKFIFSFDFTEKEKQAENIIDKLCQRFLTAEDERNWRDIAYCLSLLPFKSERSFKKLLEGWPTFQDKISEDSVHKSFLEIIKNGRFHKAQKPEIKALIDELEQKIIKQRGPEVTEASNTKKADKSKRKRKRADDDFDSDTEDEEVEIPDLESSEESNNDDDSDEEEVIITRSRRRVGQEQKKSQEEEGTQETEEAEEEEEESDYDEED